MTNAFDCSIKSRQLLIAISGGNAKWKSERELALICGHNAYLLLFACLVGCVENILNFNPARGWWGFHRVWARCHLGFIDFCGWLLWVSFGLRLPTNQPATPRLMQLRAHVCASRRPKGSRGCWKGGELSGGRGQRGGRGHLCFFGGHVKFYNFRGA